MSYPRIYVGPDQTHDVARPNASLRAVHWQRLEVRRLVEDVLDALAPRMARQAIRAEIDVPPSHWAWADVDLLRRCVLNLTLHALDAMLQGGELVITSYIGPQGFELEIADSGRGTSQELRRSFAESPTPTGSQGRAGEVALAYRLAAAHGGDITARNCPEGGAARTIRIPHHALEAAA